MTSTSSGHPLVMDDAHATVHSDPLRAALGAFEGVFNDAAVGMALLDLEGRYLKVNRRLCEVTGYEPHELVGNSVWALTHPDDLALGQSTVRQLLLGSGERTFEFEKRYRRKDGGVVWVVLSGSLVTDSHGLPQAFLAHVQDITERKWAEEALVTHNTMMQLVHAAAVGANEAATVPDAVRACLSAVCEHTGWPAAHAWLPAEDGGWLPTDLWWTANPERYASLRRVTQAVRLPASSGLVGAVAARQAARWTTELVTLPNAAVATAAEAVDVRAALAFPVLVAGEVVAVLEFFSLDTFPPDGPILEAMDQVGAQLGRVFERERASTALQASEERCRRVVETANDAFVQIDADGVVRDWNRRAEEIFGWSRAEVLGAQLSDVLVPERYRDGYLAGLRRFRETGEAAIIGRRLELSALHRDGRELPIEVSTWPIRDGRRWGFAAFLQDISARKHGQELLREAQERFKKAFDNAPIGMALVTLHGRFQEVNRALVDMLGYSETELLSMTWDAVSDGEDTHAADLLAQALAGELSTFTTEKRYRRADGASLLGLLSVSVVSDADGNPRYLVAQVEDITERKAVEAELTWRALHDPLTGLPNRDLFLDRAGQALSRSERRPSSLAMLFLDLDGFKDVNDTLGHDAGDVVLTTVASRLRAAVRPADTVARIGGDEFVILCEELSGSNEAMRIAKRLEAAVGAPIPLSNGRATLTTSVGIALASDADTDPQALLRQADAAMYRAKAAGKGRCELADAAMGRSARQRLRTETLLRHAIADQRLELVYQPTVDLQTDETVALEALLRYRAQDGTLHTAEEFLDVAEDTGLIVTMGAWALGEAYRQAARWRRLPGREQLRVAVNLSARQLATRDFFEMVQRKLGDAGVDASAVALEVTEGVLLTARDHALSGLQALRSAGVRIGLDDFGTGAASVTGLQACPVDFVKIDRELVAGLGVDERQEASVAAVIALSAALRLTTVAEAVETGAQAAMLRELGCELAQGYHFCGPRTAAEIDDILARA